MAFAFEQAAFEDAPSELWDAAQVPDDPEPAPAQDKAPEDKPVRITKAVRADIEGKVAWMLTVSASAWAMTDPRCAGVLADTSPDVAAKLTPVICQSQAAVKWFRQATSVTMWMDLLIALTPLASAVHAHHLARPAEPAADPHAPAAEYTVR